MQKSIDYVKQVLTSSPILVYPDLDKRYYLLTDSSKHSWSGILILYHENVKEDGTIVNVPHPIKYQTWHISKVLKRIGVHWSKEAHAIYMSFCKKGFKGYSC